MMNKTGFSTSVLDLSGILTKNSPSNMELGVEPEFTRKNGNSSGKIQISILSPN